MKKLYTIVYFVFASSVTALAQSEGNVWMADGMPSGGFGGSNYGLRFNGGLPEVFYYDTSTTALSGIQASQSVCDASGNPLFYTGGTSCKVYDRNGNVMPNGTGLRYPTIGTTYSLAPLICPHPGNSDQYFVIYQKNGALFYSLVDMSLNGGLGDVVAKNTSINGFGGVNGLSTVSKLTLVQGCSSIWLVVRSRNAGQFRSYEISESGLNTVPVISEVGDFSVSWYNGDVIAGKLKASPDGKLLAATIAKYYDAAGNAFVVPKGGLELYDFEKCSGKVKNARIIDTSQHFDGVAFSPDAGKLYVSSDTSVYQFDLDMGLPSAILASKTWMLSSPLIPVWIPFCYCDTTQMPIGDLKLASNGKIYMGNNTGACGSCLPSAATAKYHSIEQPNLAGLAANPMVDVISFPLGFITGADLPPDIVLPPVKPDTVTGSIVVTGCFRDTAFLMADSSGSCYRWQDDSDSSVYAATASGTYYVRYFGTDCSYHIDTFHVTMVPLPEIKQAGYSCPGAFQGRSIVQGGEGFVYNFSWLDIGGNVVREVNGRNADTVVGLDAGLNRLRITTASGCDTVLEFEVQALPVPEASFDADTIICNGRDLYFYNTSAAPLQHWYFGDGASAETRDALHSYSSGGEYDAMLRVTNMEGCSDTAVKRIHVKELLLELLASDTVVERGTLVDLKSVAPEPYTVTGWEPAGMLAGGNPYSQQVQVWTTQVFSVSGISDAYGCVASADVKVRVAPFSLMPNAFSPNGDGLNDRFRPLVEGSGYSIVSFSVFNRWGQAVFQAFGKAAELGWDGTYNGMPAEIGTYYYLLEVDNGVGKVTVRKGDVILVR